MPNAPQLEQGVALSHFIYQLISGAFNAPISNQIDTPFECGSCHTVIDQITESIGGILEDNERTARGRKEFRDGVLSAIGPRSWVDWAGRMRG